MLNITAVWKLNERFTGLMSMLNFILVSHQVLINGYGRVGQTLFDVTQTGNKNKQPRYVTQPGNETQHVNNKVFERSAQYMVRSSGDSYPNSSLSFCGICLH